MTRIKDLRRERGETQESLAALIGITRGAYANIENGKREPDIKTMTVLANHFGVTIDQLLGHEEATEKPASVSTDGLDPELLDLIKRIPDDRMPEVERYLRFQAEQREKT